MKRSHIAVLHDVFMAAASFVVSLYLRLGDDFAQSSVYFWPGIGLFTAICATVFYFMGLYRGVWRYASMQDLMAITKAVSLAILIFVPTMFVVTRLEGFPRSVMMINWLVLIAFLGAPRFLYRTIKDGEFKLDFNHYAEDKRIPVLLAGISDTAIHFLRENSKRYNFDYRVVGIVDNDRKNVGSWIHGVKVYGTFGTIPKTVKRLKREGSAPQRILLTLDHLDGPTIRTLVKTADTLGLTLAKLPRLTDFNDTIEKIRIKPVAIEDLLGRAQAAPSLSQRKELVRGKTILVTGAGGTIGSELVRQIAAQEPRCIILLELCEYNLYRIDHELEGQFPAVQKVSLIGDIRNKEFLQDIFATYSPELVFHAAALKHVPIVEHNLVEASLTNIIGTKNIADVSLQHGVAKMVMISTDKAVNPSSLMGVTKRIAEYYVHSLGRAKRKQKTEFAIVRFGNVLGSSGSVIPLFQKQLENGGPITITHPDMTRYFMTVPEAVELVLQASTIDQGADSSAIFVLDMGEPVRINDLALQMIKLAGLRPHTDISIEYIGIRPGEKLYEELFYQHEHKEATPYEAIMQARSANDIDAAVLAKAVSNVEALCHARDVTRLLSQLITLVPEYENQQKVHAA